MRIPDLSPKEKVVEAYLRDEIRKLGGKAYKFVSPANRSVPDRLVLMPHGFILFVEVKRSKGKLTPGQTKEIERIQSLGFPVHVVYGKPDVDTLIKMIKHGIV